MSDIESKGVSPLEGEGLRGDGKAKWYVVHTYSGHENKVKVNIEKMVENRGMQDLIIDIVVPTEDRVEIKDGQRKIKTKKMFPGYVITVSYTHLDVYKRQLHGCLAELKSLSYHCLPAYFSQGQPG